MCRAAADDGSDYRARTVLAADAFVNVATLGFAEAAAAVQSVGVHIFMDMQLHTRGPCSLTPHSPPPPHCGRAVAFTLSHTPRSLSDTRTEPHTETLRHTFSALMLQAWCFDAGAREKMVSLRPAPIAVRRTRPLP